MIMMRIRMMMMMCLYSHQQFQTFTILLLLFQGQFKEEWLIGKLSSFSCNGSTYY